MDLAKRIAALQKKLKPGESALPAKERSKLATEGADGLAILLAVEHRNWKATVSPVSTSAKAVATKALGKLASKLPQTIAFLGKATAVATARANDADYTVFTVAMSYGPAIFAIAPPLAKPATKHEELAALYRQCNGIGILCDEHGEFGVDPGIVPEDSIAKPGVENNKDLTRISRGVGEAGEGGWCLTKTGIVHVDDQFGQRGEQLDDFWAFLDLLLSGREDELPWAESY